MKWITIVGLTVSPACALTATEGAAVFDAAQNGAWCEDSAPIVWVYRGTADAPRRSASEVIVARFTEIDLSSGRVDGLPIGIAAGPGPTVHVDAGLRWGRLIVRPDGKSYTVEWDGKRSVFRPC